MTNAWIVSIEWRNVPRVKTILLRRKWIFVGTCDAKLLHPEVKCGPLDSQTRGRTVGAGHNPTGLLESLANVVSLRVLHGNWPKRFHLSGVRQARERALQ